MNEKELQDLNILVNAYAGNKINTILTELEDAMKASNGDVIYTRTMANRIVGKYIALAYAQGYKDRFEKIEPKRNIFM